MLDNVLKQASHIEIWFGRYAVVNAVNKNWLIMKKSEEHEARLGDYVQTPNEGGNISFPSLEMACTYALGLSLAD